MAWEKDFVLCEGSGHAGVGSVFDLSNARVAKLLGAKVIIVSQGGIGKPIDEIALNQALFEKEGVPIIGVILNKVVGEKMEYISDFARRGLKRKGLELLGVLPYEHTLGHPSVELIREELDAELLNPTAIDGWTLVKRCFIGAMSAQNAIPFFNTGTPVDYTGRPRRHRAGGLREPGIARRPFADGGHHPHRWHSSARQHFKNYPHHRSAIHVGEKGQLRGGVQGEQSHR